MYAIIEDSGTQIKVSPGDVVVINLRDGVEEGASITFERVLAVGDGEQPARIGTPYLDGATVEAEVLESFKDRKVEIVKFKRRKGYQRKRGHRQPYLRVRIADVKA